MKNSPIFLLGLMFCLRLHANTVYVDAAAAGSNNGTNWTNAFNNLQDGLAVVAAGDSIFIAQGTYTPAAGTSFTLKPGIYLFGGFPHGGNPDFTDRNWTNFVTIIKGNSGSLPVFNDITITLPTFINGVHITGAKTFDEAGVLHVTGSNTLHFTDTKFYNNIGTTVGGIFFNQHGSLDFDRCIFSNNTNMERGGFVFNEGGTVTINNSDFTDNTSYVAGGIFYGSNGSFSVNRSRFLNNKTEGLFYIDGGTAAFTSCAFAGNKALKNSILHVTQDGASAFTNCVFFDNTITISASVGGGLIYCSYGGHLDVVNSTFFANLIGQTTSTLFHNEFSGTSNFINSIIWGNYNAVISSIGNSGGAATFGYSIVQGISDPANHVYNTDPLFSGRMHPVGNDGVWGTADDGLQIMVNSPAKDAGNNDAVPSLLTTDFIDNPRVQTGKVDMGAYEYLLNEAPVLITTTGSTLHSLSITSTLVDGGIRIIEGYSPTLTTATVAITENFSPGDFLSLTTSADIGNITASYDNTTGILTLVSDGGTATIGEWQNALRAIAFGNNLDAPDLEDRKVSFTVNDGKLSSNTAVKFVELMKSICQATFSNTTIGICPSSFPYTWNGQSFSSPGTYRMHFTNARGCDSSANLILVVDNGNSCLSLNIVTQPESCNKKDGSITATGTGGSAPYLYSIDGGMHYQSGNLFSGLVQQVYHITIKDAVNDSVTVSATVRADICISLSSTPAACDQNTGSISITGTGGNSPYRYSVDGVNFQTSNTFQGLSADEYHVTMLDASENTITAAIIVEKDICLILHAVPATTTCGKNNGVIEASVENGTPPYKFSINGSNFQSEHIFPNLSPGTYTLAGKDANDLMTQLTVTVPGSERGRISAGNDSSIAINQVVQLMATDINGVGYNQFSWSPSTSLNNPSIQNPVATIIGNITYTVIGTTSAGCKDTASIAIEAFLESEIYVPNAFTPNEDGKNDVLRAIPAGIKEFHHFAVYNRWGQCVFYTTTPDKGWDGKVNGNLQNTQQFVWIAAGTAYDGKYISRKGYVLLIQ